MQPPLWFPLDRPKALNEPPQIALPHELSYELPGGRDSSSQYCVAWIRVQIKRNTRQGLIQH